MIDQYIPCPVCRTQIPIDLHLLIQGVQFSCPNCQAAIGLASESRSVVSEAIHHAIVSASDSLMDKNEGLLDKYFEKPVDGEGKNKGALVPKIVQLEYPALDDTGAVTTTTVQVPLITLVPVTASKIEKATVTAEFALEVINDELQISFPNKKISENATVGKLEIVISPQELTDGLELIIEGYANALKRQIT